jgi:6-pyruvoyltetrahydropterin/6-carboxytetrahydropterin synthase
MKISVFRKEQFNAAHRLYNPAWKEEKNEAIFGKCNNPNFHGHNYELVVRIIGELDPETGYVYDLKKLKEVIRESVIKRFDHKNLNLDTEEFRNMNPTAENIAVAIYNLLRDRIEENYEIKITLYETERNFVEYPS